MSIKSKGRTLGRMVRRITGLPLPLCMKVGKLVAQGKFEYEIQERVPELKGDWFQCGDKCCSGTRYTLTGPRGSIESDYSFNDTAIKKEYNLSCSAKRHDLGHIPKAPDTVRTPPPAMEV